MEAGDNLYLDNPEATGFYRVNAAEAQPGDILICCFGSSVANHAAIYCGDGGNCCTIFLTSSVNARGIPTNGNAAHSIWRHRHGTSLPSRDLQPFGRRFSLSIKNGAEAIYALAMQIPGFRQKMNDGWYRYALQAGCE